MTSSPDYIARLLLLGLILAINAFFAASEVALLSVRDSRLRHLAEEGNAGAKIALALLAQPEKLLSVTQIGVTLASLGLGWAGEDTLYALLMSLFHPILTAGTATILRAICFVAAFAVMTYCHVVIGEVVPKNLAIDKADRLAIVVAPALMVFYRLTSVFVTVIEGSARGLTRLLGVKASHRGGGHSAEELKLVVSSSRFAGNLPKLQEDMIHRVLDLDDLYVREIMKPRREIVSVSADASLDEVLKTMVESQHSRLPVWEEKPEQIIGAVFFKDMLRLWHERRIALHAGRSAASFHLAHIMRKPLIVPETKPLMQMLEEFRQRHSHMALVVDEFGTVTGLLTVEDVLEQIVGEIEDEFDEKLPAPHAQDDRKDLDGATSILDLASIYGIELPANGGFETIAGYMLFKLGHIPQAGESVEFDGQRFTVTTMDRNRIAVVSIETTSDERKKERRKLLGIDPKAAQCTWTAALVLLLLGMVYLIREVLIVFVIALLFAYLLYPLMALIDRHLTSKTRTPALAITFILAIGILAGLGVSVGSVVAEQAANLTAQAPGFLDRIRQNPVPGPQAVTSLKSQAIGIIEGQLRQHYNDVAMVVPRVAIKVLSASGNLIYLILIPILSFLILRDGRTILNTFLEVLEPGQENENSTARDTLADVHELLLLYMRALLFLCCATLISYSIVLSAIGLPYPILLAAIAFALEFIPLVGPLTASLIIIAVSIISGYPHVLWVVIFLVVYRLIQDYGLSPLLMSKGVELHPLMIIFGVLAGGEIGGVAGVFLSIPALALIRLSYHRVRKVRSARRLSVTQ